MRPLHYIEYEPGAAAAGIALSYSCFSVRELPASDFVHRVWPDGCMSLVFVCSAERCTAVHLVGVLTQAIDVPVRAGMRYWGVRFRPEAGAAWSGVDPRSLRDRHVDAATAVGDVVTTAAAAITAPHDAPAVTATLDMMIGARPPLTPIDAVVCDAANVIMRGNGQVAIAGVAERLGVSPRSLQRRFRAATGLSPKEFSSIRRSRAAMVRVVRDAGPERTAWSGVALESGFADQAHMHRELSRLTRFTPRNLESRLDTIDHEQLVD